MELGDASPSSIIIKIILIINTIIPHDHAFNNIKMQLRTWSSALLCYAARHLDVQSVPVILHSTACSQHSHSCVFTLVENCHHLTFWLQRLHHNTTTYSTTGVSCMRHALFMLFTPDNKKQKCHFCGLWMNFCASCSWNDSFSPQAELPVHNNTRNSTLYLQPQADARYSHNNRPFSTTNII